MPDKDRTYLLKEMTRTINEADSTAAYCLCQTWILEEALQLLKEQEAEWIEYPECLKYEGALDDSYIVCSRCEHVFNIIDNCTEEFDYCPHCGAKMTDRR